MIVFNISLGLLDLIVHFHGDLAGYVDFRYDRFSGSEYDRFSICVNRRGEYMLFHEHFRTFSFDPTWSMNGTWNNLNTRPIIDGLN